MTNYEWLESARSLAEEESCWSDLLGDEEENKCSNIRTIEENNSSLDLCDSRTGDKEKKMSRGKDDAASKQHTADVVDTSKDF